MRRAARPIPRMPAGIDPRRSTGAQQVMDTSVMPDNPPAFPRTGEGFGNDLYDTPGMSLRDWFAGQALVACGEPYGGRTDDTHARRDYLYREHAKRLYAIADAMLTARTQVGGG